MFPPLLLPLLNKPASPPPLSASAGSRLGLGFGLLDRPEGEVASLIPPLNFPSVCVLPACSNRSAAVAGSRVEFTAEGSAEAELLDATLGVD